MSMGGIGRQRKGAQRRPQPTCPLCSSPVKVDCSLPADLCPMRVCTGFPECEWNGIQRGEHLRGQSSDPAWSTVDDEEWNRLALEEDESTVSIEDVVAVFASAPLTALPGLPRGQRARVARRHRS